MALHEINNERAKGKIPIIRNEELVKVNWLNG